MSTFKKLHIVKKSGCWIEKDILVALNEYDMLNIVDIENIN